jgi:hypothetical protein
MASLAPRLSQLLPLPALLLVACGGAEDGRPERPTQTATEALDECAVLEQRLDEGWEFQNIVDFEPPGGATTPAWTARCPPEVPCGFYFNYDSVTSPIPLSACAKQLGVSYDFGLLAGQEIYPEALPKPRCGSSQAAYHLNVPQLSMCLNDEGRQGWGATLQITINANSMDSGQADEVYDASDWDGVALWVRLGEHPGNRAILVSAKDRYTARAPAMPLGGEDYCRTDEGAADAEKCDPFGLAVLVEPEWRFVKLPFSLMQQKGFGVPSPHEGLDTALLVGLEVLFSSGDWDVWVDDLAFYREPR